MVNCLRQPPEVIDNRAQSILLAMRSHRTDYVPKKTFQWLACVCRDPLKNTVYPYE